MNCTVIKNFRKYINKEVQKFSDDWWNGTNGNPPAWERY